MWPTVIACIFHFLFRTSVFFEQPTQPCSAAPSFPSFLILVSTLMILTDIKLFPDRYADLPNWFQFGTKVFISMLLVEFAMVFVWCRLESVVQKFFKCVLMDGDLNMYADMGGDALPAAVIMLISIMVFYYSGEATKCFAAVKSVFGSVIVNVMIFVRSIKTKFQEQILVTFMQRSGEPEDISEPTCPPPVCQPICPTRIVCTMQQPTVTCCSTAVQEIPCRDENRCPVNFQCMQPPPTVTCNLAVDQEAPCRDTNRCPVSDQCMPPPPPVDCSSAGSRDPSCGGVKRCPPNFKREPISRRTRSRCRK